MVNIWRIQPGNRLSGIDLFRKKEKDQASAVAQTEFFGSFTLQTYKLKCSFEQLYSFVLQTNLSQRYTDMPVISDRCDQWYSSSALLKRSLNQIYDSATKVTLKLDHSYSITYSVTKYINQFASISSGVLKAVSESVYSLLGATSVLCSLPQVYSLFPSDLTSDDIITVVMTLPVVIVPPVPGDPIIVPSSQESVGLDILSIDISYSQSSYIARGSMSLALYSEWESIELLSDVLLTINGTEHNLIAVSKTKSEDHSKLSLQVELSSPAILLSFPYAKEVPKDFTISGTMSQVVNSIAALEGFSVVWEIPVNDVLTSSQVQVESEAPIDVIRKIVNDLGGILQSYPDGTIHAVPRYKIDSDKYTVGSAIKTFSSGIDFLSLSEETEKRDGFNKYSITSSSLTDGWKFESEEISSSRFKLKASKVPWSSTAPTVTTSELTNVTITFTPEPVEEEIEEEVEIINGEGKLNNSCYLVISFNYKTSTNLGTITATEEGNLTPVTKGNSLVTIKYITKYWMWAVENPDKENVQFILEA